MSGSTIRRVPIIAGNWKMNLGPTEARDFAASILADLVALPSVERVLCPPAIAIPAVHAVTSGSDLRLGAQNMYFEEKGAYTGEISPLMLQGLCEYVILGHSERRGYFGETDELVNRKALSAFAHRLRPIVCVGRFGNGVGVVRGGRVRPWGSPRVAWPTGCEAGGRGHRWCGGGSRGGTETGWCYVCVVGAVDGSGPLCQHP